MLSIVTQGYGVSGPSLIATQGYGATAAVASGSGYDPGGGLPPELLKKIRRRLGLPPEPFDAEIVPRQPKPKPVDKHLVLAAAGEDWLDRLREIDELVFVQGVPIAKAEELVLLRPGRRID